MCLKITLISLLIALCSISAECAEETKPLEIGDAVKLPTPYREGNISIEQAIQERRSVRVFTDVPLRPRHVSQLLWAAGGETIDGVTGPTRAYPSAGGIYPLEIYLVIGNMMVLESGIYRYDWERHSLVFLKKGDFRASLTEAALGQRMIQDAPVTIVVTAVYQKTGGRYGKRGMTRYVHMDAGHMGQNVHLMAHSMGLGTVMLGAFTDSEVAKVLGIRKEIPIYIMPVGYPKE